ncbi:B3/4 domain-containing protein [Metabacillus sp. RGM 3146]|uniref:B3/B4 domain-containing protein n=1 Tax=Metabacillus sp. RGM 3146 TaxID=3401092 RepID=UPI003B99DB55
MEISIDRKVKELIPDFKVGVLTYHHIEVGSSPQMLKGRFRLFQESLVLDLEGMEVNSLPGISEWRDVFKKTGTDPNRYRPANEALYRRIQKQQFLNPVHSAADVNNFFSLRYEIPLGIYDLNEINGNVTITIGDADSSYPAINGRDVSMGGKLLSADDIGPFGSPYVDSKRTACTEETTKALQIVYLKPSMKEEEANKLLRSLSDMFTQVHGGTSDIQIIR